MSSPAFIELSRTIEASPPLAALVLGSGLNEVVDDQPCLASARFDELPGMPAAGVVGHRGQAALFEFNQSTLLVFQGRLHFYEGHSWELVERPMRLVLDWGIRTVVLTNAAGGIGPNQSPGTLMAIRDHIDAMRPNWWRGAKPDLADSSPYSALLERMRQAARNSNVDLTEGTYAGMTGPSYETPAEIRALRGLGADAVGMSTIHEARAAHALGMQVAAISCIANRAAGLSAAPLSHAEVLSGVQAAAGRMAKLVRAFLSTM